MDPDIPVVTMCGIAGFVGTGETEVLARMTAMLTHRGPDAEGLWSDRQAGIFLGHRRLSIVDLAGGTQPMWTPDKEIGVIFNGEIYNHIDLRRELQGLGVVFESDHSDTEVLLHAYRQWGDEFVHRLNGMWAFAVCDSVRRRILLSRDRFGKKPLYWFQRNGAFGFASELTALLAHPSCPKSTSPQGVAKFFAHALVPGPGTMIDGVSKLPGGHNLVFDLGSGQIRISKFWEYLLEPAEPSNEPDLADELLHLLDAAVKRRLMADVPLGVFLSGGIDSSLVTALASRHAGSSPLQTFSIGFEEATFDESPHAAAVAEKFQTRHHSEILSLDRAVDLLPEILAKLDEPQGDASLLPTWLLSRFTRRHVTVALGGDGGDELFAGYDPFRALRAADLYSQMVPRSIHPALRMLAGMLPVSHANLSLDFKVKRTLRGLSHRPALWNPVWMGALEPHEIESATGVRMTAEELYAEAIVAWESAPRGDLVDRSLQFFTRIYLQDGILAKVDRASMLNSLEVRAPFLDIEIADFARRLPNRFKLCGGATKYLLKQAAEKVLPAAIVHRKKKGFGIPVGAWMRSGRIAPESQTQFVRDRLAAHMRGRADERLFLWCQYVLEAWEKNRPGSGTR